MLPYPDPVRRRRVRSAARSLVDCEPWPDDDATTGADAAKLALLRLLWLQRQTRSAAQHRNGEATVLLARSSVEACILGLYCLHKPDAIPRLKAANIKAMGGMLGYLVEDGILPKGLVNDALAAFGPSGKAPDVFQMAQFVDSVLPKSGAVSLYRRFYVPTSTFFVHANAASLLRHVRADDRLTSRPLVPWTRRSAVRISDACVGILADAVAHSAGQPSAAFDEYANAHMMRAFTPMAVVAGRGLRHTMKLKEMPVLIRTIRALRQYAASKQAVTDAPDVRETRVREGFEPLMRALMDPSLPEAVLRSTRDHFVAEIVAGITAQAPQVAPEQDA